MRRRVRERYSRYIIEKEREGERKIQYRYNREIERERGDIADRAKNTRDLSPRAQCSKTTKLIYEEGKGE